MSVLLARYDWRLSIRQGRRAEPSQKSLLSNLIVTTAKLCRRYKTPTQGNYTFENTLQVPAMYNNICLRKFRSHPTSTQVPITSQHSLQPPWCFPSTCTYGSLEEDHDPCYESFATYVSIARCRLAVVTIGVLARQHLLHPPPPLPPPPPRRPNH